MPSNKILVTGANGQLGKDMRALEIKYAQYDFVFADHSELPIEDESKVDEYVKQLQPFALVNCAAYTAVDRAESEKEKAELINAKAVGFLAAACHENKSLFIHVSTDYVFDGKSSVPYKENDETNPVNHYGLTKLRGEALAIKANPASIIIRTSWVYSEYGNNFVKTMIRLMRERESINVVNDQVGSPTYAAHLAEAIMQIISVTNGHRPSAIAVFNYSNEGVITWYEFAEAIRELIGSNCKVNPIPSSQYPTPSKRPSFSLLDKTKFKSTFGLAIPGWKESLARCIKRLTV
jgi:dTDP-4-dehydrorhamnose reductase